MILLVDDDQQFCEELTRVLQRERPALIAKNGGQALGLLKVIEFRVAIVDLNLPDQNGFELIQSIHAEFPDLPIVAISGVCSGSVLESAREFGAVEVLPKPVTSEWRAVVERLSELGAA